MYGINLLRMSDSHEPEQKTKSPVMPELQTRDSYNIHCWIPPGTRALVRWLKRLHVPYDLNEKDKTMKIRK